MFRLLGVVRSVRLAVVFAALVLALPSAARAGQDVITKESAAVLKTAYAADIEAMRAKFLGLAEAFPQDKYTWRPMDGVRSVSEVFALIASEGYAFIPGSVGAQPGLSREEIAKLNAITDKAQLIAHLNKAFDHAKQTLASVDPATLLGRRPMMGGQQMSAPEIFLFLGGDMHEHLGQLISYARMNRIVPPWSK